MRIGLRRVCGALLAGIIVVWPAPAPALVPVPQAFTARSREVVRLARPAVTHAIAQTPDGFVWFGTTGGLLRADGERVQEMPLGNDSLGGVRALAVDAAGRLWIATGGGFLDQPLQTGGPHVVGLREGSGGLFVRQPDGRVHIVFPPDGAPSHWAWALAPLEDGTMAVGTEDGLWRVSPGAAFAAERVALPAQIGHPFVALLAAADDGGLWIGTGAGVWHRDRNAQVRSVSVVAARALVAEPRSVLWIITDAEIVRTEHGREPMRVHPRPDMQFRRLLPDAGGAPWIGTTIGLYRLRGGSLVEAPEEVPQQTIRALMRDREGNVWASVKGVGVVLLRVPAVRHLGRAEGLPTDAVLSLLPAPSGALWLTTSVGLVSVDAGRVERLALHLPSNLVPAWTLRNLAQQRDGKLWLGWGALVGREIDGRVRLHVPATLPDHVRSVHVDVAGDLWIGWDAGGLTRWRGGSMAGTPETLNASNGVCPGAISALRNRAGGGLWATGDGGLTVVDRELRARCLRGDEVFPGAALQDVAEAPDGTAWVTAIGATGLYQVRDGVVKPLPAEHPFPGRALYAATADGRGHVWFSSARGVFRARAADLEARAERRGPVPLPYWVDDRIGMRSPDCQSTFSPTLIPTDDGGALVATQLGVEAIAAPESLPVARVAPVIDRFSVDGDSRALDGRALEVAAGVEHVEIRFAAPTFVAAQRPRFEQRLDGFDRAWSPAHEDHTADLARLPSGNYRFRVRLGGEPAAEATVAFVVLAPWWRRAPVVPATLGTMISIALALHRVRLRRVSARYEAITQERARIARELHDGLAQQFLGIGYQLEALSRRLPPEGAEVHGLIDDARAMVKEAQADTRRVLWTLRGGLEPDALARALERLAEETRRHTGAHVSVRVSGTLPPSPVLTYELPKIAREAVTNALRHGAARRVQIAVDATVRDVLLTVDDDGAGVGNAPAESGGFGIVGMRERAERCGGSLTLGDRPEGGARLRVTIPASRVPGVGGAAPRGMAYDPGEEDSRG